MKNRGLVYGAPLLAALLFIILLAASPQRADAQVVHLSLGSSIDFPNANPTTVPSIPANQNPIPVSINIIGIGVWSLVVLAGSDLTSGSNTIAITHVHYVLAGLANASGTLSKGLNITLASGAMLLSPPQPGTLSFYLDNSWNYPTGYYTATVIITAIAL